MIQSKPLSGSRPLYSTSSSEGEGIGSSLTQGIYSSNKSGDDE